MFIFGHLGIGSQIVRRWSKDLSRRLILLGTLLPDIIDKPLYYGLNLITGRHGAELGLISGTRTIGHTALFLIVLAGFAFYRKSKFAAALSLGVGSHLLLDSFSDLMGGGAVSSAMQQASPLFWPLQGGSFPDYPFQSVGDHLSIVHKPLILWSEVVGFLVLVWNLWSDSIQRKKQKSKAAQ